jgi:hypothetical protein
MPKPVPDNSPPPTVIRKVCFVISPIGGPDTEIRKKSDQVLKHLIKPILQEKYSLERADKMGRPGIITVQVVQQLLEADLVIADLTDQNANVFYELAIRHAARKPAIHIVSRGQQDVPFDVQDMRFVPYDLADPDRLEEARNGLRDAVAAIERGEAVTTPVQMAQILQSLEQVQHMDARLRDLFEALFTSMNVGMSNLQEGIAEIVQDVRQRNIGETNSLWTSGSLPVRLSTLVSPPASGFNFPSGIRQLAKPGPKASAEAMKKTREAEEDEGQK